MRRYRVLSICLLLCVSATARAEYIEITYPEDGAGFYNCGPTEVRWESDIDPGAGDVIRVAYEIWWYDDGRTIGIGPNDGYQHWSSPPCVDPDTYAKPIRYHLRVEYLDNPSVYDEVHFWVQLGLAPPLSMAVDFSGDATSYVDVDCRADPAMYTNLDAYLVMLYPTEGFTSVSFAVEVGPPSVLVAPSHTNLLPGGLAIGDWETGITLATTECQDSQVVQVARVSAFYILGEGYITIKDHPDFPRWVVDCEQPGNDMEYGLWCHGGVWRDPPSTPVEARSWGSIKALYR